MSGAVRVPPPVNEPVFSYAPGTPERAALVARLAEKPAELKPAVEHWEATAEPLAGDWPARLFLARAAAGALHRDQLSPLWELEKLDPLIALRSE